jgi:branched-chain amino acid transport system ATP-binding protein
LIGHNGAGKSTLLKAIFGMISIKEGQLYLDGAPVTGPIPSQMLARGVVYVPQGNRVFPDLTVYENLMMAGFTMQSRHKRVEGGELPAGAFA